MLNSITLKTSSISTILGEEGGGRSEKESENRRKRELQKLLRVRVVMWWGGRLHMVLRKLLRFRVFSRGGGGTGEGVFYKTTNERNFEYFAFEYSLGEGEAAYRTSKTS